MGLCLIMGVEIVRRIDVEAKNVSSSIRRSDSTFSLSKFSGLVRFVVRCSGQYK